MIVGPPPHGAFDGAFLPDCPSLAAAGCEAGSGAGDVVFCWGSLDAKTSGTVGGSLVEWATPEPPPAAGGVGEGRADFGSGVAQITAGPEGVFTAIVGLPPQTDFASASFCCPAFCACGVAACCPPCCGGGFGGGVALAPASKPAKASGPSNAARAMSEPGRRRRGARWW